MDLKLEQVMWGWWYPRIPPNYELQTHLPVHMLALVAFKIRVVCSLMYHVQENITLSKVIDADYLDLQRDVGSIYSLYQMR